MLQIIKPREEILKELEITLDKYVDVFKFNSKYKYDY